MEKCKSVILDVVRVLNLLISLMSLIATVRAAIACKALRTSEVATKEIDIGNEEKISPVQLVIFVMSVVTLILSIVTVILKSKKDNEI